MKLFGWIPHLAPSLDALILNLLTKIATPVDIFCDDTGESNPMHIEFEFPKQFEYEKTPMVIRATYGNATLDVTMVLDNRGLLSLEVSRQTNVSLTQSRYVLREIYFEVKRRLHCDTHHQRDERNKNCLSGPDEQLSLTHEDKTKEQALVEIFNSLLNSIQNKNDGLSRIIAMPRFEDEKKWFYKI